MVSADAADADREAAREIGRRTAVDRGFPEQVEDPAVLDVALPPFVVVRPPKRAR